MGGVSRRQFFGPYTKGVMLQTVYLNHNPILLKYRNSEKSKYDTYLAISESLFLSYVVGVDT